MSGEGTVELTEAQCEELLATDSIGRIAFVTPAGPRIVPVNYVVVDRALEFRTTAYTELATYGPDTEIAFEVDQLDAERRRGWSVVAHGRCERLADAEELRWRVPEQVPEPWAGGFRPLALRLAWSSLTGRRVGGEHWPFPVVSGRGPLRH